jgi:hypothetical protein
MNHTERAQQLETLTREIKHALKPDDHNRTPISRMTDARNGQPRAARYDGDKVTASGTSDPTANAALQPDPAATDLARLDACLDVARRSLIRAADILRQWTPRHPTDLERHRMATTNEPHCESCARTEAAKGVPRWEPPLTVERTTVAGTLNEPQWLCRWCYDHTTRTGVRPTVDELEQHHEGRRVRCPHPDRKDQP